MPLLRVFCKTVVCLPVPKLGCNLFLCDSVCGFHLKAVIVLRHVSVSFYSVFLSCLQTHQDRACAMRWSLSQPFCLAEYFPTRLTCRHGVMWEYEGLEVAGLHWHIQGLCRSIAAGAQLGPVCLSKHCLSGSRGPAESQPAPVPGHSSGRQRWGFHHSFGPVLPAHSPT